MIAFDYGGTLRVSDGRADLRDLATRLAPIVVISAIQRGHEASIESEIRALGIPLKAVEFVYYNPNPTEEEMVEVGRQKAEVMKRYGCDVLVDDSAHVRKGVRLSGLWAFFMLMCAVTLGEECCVPSMGYPPLNGANHWDIKQYVLGTIGALIDKPQPGFQAEGISVVQDAPYTPCKKVASTICRVDWGNGEGCAAVGRATGYLAVANVDEAWVMAVVSSPISPAQELELQKLRSKVAYLKGKGVPIYVHTTVLRADHPPDLPGGETDPECCGAGELPEKVTTSNKA